MGFYGLCTNVRVAAAMFPYKIRKAAWGCLKPPKEVLDDPIEASSSSLLRLWDDDPQVIGGNLQRAILMDLVDLRRRWYHVAQQQQLTRSGSSPTTAVVDSVANEITATIVAPSSFADFKACFREARFGGIHTRTIPPRVDRGEYVQLLYSCCFHLLETSFEDSHDADSMSSRCWDDSRTFTDAIYSVFMLYALHKTNVLPVAPSRRSHSKRTRRGKFVEHSLRESCSMLPIGINSDEDKLYRRAFMSPVRIDRWSYTLILRLRAACLARAEHCQVEAMVSKSTMNACCRLARHAAHIIDIMLSDDSFFDYCEYHGPHGLEALAGSSNFYRAHFPSNSDKRINKNRSKAMSAMTKLQVKMVGKESDIIDSLDLLNLSKLVDSHCSNLDSVVTNLRLSRSTSKDKLKPKQRDLVENTLSGIINGPTYVELINNLNVKRGPILNSIDASATDKIEAKDLPKKKAVHSKHQLLLKFPEILSSLLCDIDVLDDAIQTRKTIMKENRVRLKGESTSIDADMCPDQDFVDYMDLDINQQKEKTASDGNVSNSSTVQKRKKPRREVDTILKIQQERVRVDRMENINLDDISISTGPGKNALLSLLLKSNGNEDDLDDDIPTDVFAQDDDLSIGTGAGQNVLYSLLSMAVGNTYNSDQFEDEPSEDDDDNNSNNSYPKLQSLNSAALEVNDDASVTSGIGMRSLHFLLTGQEDECAASKRAKAGKRKKKSLKHIKHMPSLPTVHTSSSKPHPVQLEECVLADTPMEYEDDHQLADDDAGRNALSALLLSIETIEYV